MLRVAIRNTLRHLIKKNEEAKREVAAGLADVRVDECLLQLLLLLQQNSVLLWD